MVHPYHEAFWVVIGTAAPVIILAASVAASQLLGETAFRDDIVVLPRRLRLAAANSLALGFCWWFEITALIFALISLRGDHDWGNAGGETYAMAATAVSLLLVFAQVTMAAFIRMPLSADERVALSREETASRNQRYDLPPGRLRSREFRRRARGEVRP